MVGKEHIIERCVWHSGFDDEHMAHALQEQLSSWSKESLQVELQKVLEELCPPSQTWRISSLSIDLGSIEFGELNRELNFRFANSLKKAIRDLILKKQVNNQTIEIVEESGTWMDLMEQFLQSGTVPWWYSSEHGTVQQIFESLLSGHSVHLASLVREIGKDRRVRQRIVWQMGETLVRKLIGVLEPHHAKEILDIADNMFQLQRKKRVVKTDERAFRNNTLLWILDHLLVERGTLFNTVSFVRSTLKQMALHHNIALQSLIKIVADAVGALKESMKFSTVFIQAVIIIGKEQHAVEQKQIATPQSPDFWQTLEQLIRNNATQDKLEGRAIKLAEVFSALANEDPSRMRSLILSLGQEEQTRKHLVAQFDQPELEQLVQIVVPSESAFVMAYVYHTQEATKSDVAEGYSSRTPGLIWEVVLAYLLVDRGSRFNKKEFLRRTILSLSKKHNLSYLSLLSLLTYQKITAPTNVGLEPDLIFLLNDLTSEELTSSKGKQQLLAGQLNAFRQYIKGKTPQQRPLEFYLPDQQELIETLLNREPARVLAVLKKEGSALRTAKQLVNVLNERQLTKLLRVANHELMGVVEAILELLAKRQTNVDSKWLGTDFRSVVHLLAVQYLLDHPVTSIRSEMLWEYFIEGLAKHYVIASEIVALTIYDGMGVGAESAAEIAMSSETETKHLTVKIGKKDSFLEVVQQLLHGAGVSNASELFHNVKTLRKLVHQPKVLSDVIRRVSDRAQQQVWDELLTDGFKFFEASKKALVTALQRLAPFSKLTLHQQNWIDELLWRCALEQQHDGDVNKLISSVIKGVVYKLGLSRISLLLVLKSISGSDTNLKLDWTKVAEYLGANKSKVASDKTGWKKLLKVASDTELEYTLLQGGVGQLKEHIKKDNKGAKTLEELSRRVELKVLLATISMSLKSEDRKVLIRLEQLYNWLQWKSFSLKINADIEAQIRKLILASWTTDNWKLAEVEAITDQLFEAHSELATLPKGSPSLVAAIPSWLREKMNEGIAQNTLSSGPGDVALPEKNTTDSEMHSDLVQAILHGGQIPQWVAASGAKNAKKLLQRIATEQPADLLQALKSMPVSEPARDRLVDALSYSEFAKAIVAEHSNLKSTLQVLEQLYDMMPNIEIPGINGRSIQYIIYRKTINALINNNWRALDPKNFLQELIWTLIRDHHIPNSKILKALEVHRHMLPSPMMMSLSAMLANERQKQQAIEIQEQLLIREEEKPMEEQESVMVTNAGIVILQSFLPMLFERVGVVSDGEFVSQEAKQKGVHIVQFLATGQTTTEEHHLVLNKLLCGLEMTDPVPESYDLSDTDKETCTGLINAAVGYWSAIGETSPDGFRGNWLIRDGKLVADGDKYNLDVEHRSYDILLNKSPFTFSIIKHHWMDKPIHVSWSY